MKTILIIEDNLDVRENTAEILSLSGYNVLTAENGLKGIATAKATTPDLILCDVMMPNLDGFGVRKILNSDSVLMNVPFIFLTAKADKMDFRKGMGLGADDYITKPYDDVHLLEAIEIRLKKASKKQKNTEQKSHHFYNTDNVKKTIKKLLEGVETRQFKRKDSIYQEGQFPKWVYWVRSGMVKTCQKSSTDKELILDIQIKENFLDLASILLEKKNATYATAMQDTEIALIPIKTFQDMLHSSQDFATMITFLSLESKAHLQFKLSNIAFSSMRKKLSQALIFLANKTGSNSFEIYREDLSALTASAKETTIRTLSNFKAENLIDIKGHTIRLLDIDRLRNMRN